MGEEAPPSPVMRPVFYDGCPGCAMEWKLESSQGIPYKEFFFVGITTIASSLPISSLFPFLYFMIEDLRVAKKEQDIGLYAGFLGKSYGSISWGIGLVVGPAIGGYFAQPVKQYPNVFSEKSRFPYFLPCLCISLIALVVLISCIWLLIFSLWAVSDKRYGGLSFSSKEVGQVLAVADNYHNGHFPTPK